MQHFETKQNLVVGIADPTLQKVFSKKSTTQYFDKACLQPIFTIHDEYFQKTSKLTIEESSHKLGIPTKKIQKRSKVL